MADYSTFRADITIEFNSASGLITIPNENVHALVIDSNYDLLNMPIAYVSMSVDKKLLDKIILERDSSSFIVTVDKYDSSKDSKFNSRYLKTEFTYFINNDINYNRDIDYNDTSEYKTEDLYQKILIGLIDMNCINQNKKTINAIYKGATKTDILIYNMNHIKLVMEPIRTDKAIPQFIVPGITSITDLIKYVNSFDNLYTTPYRFFMDLNQSYLVSSSGVPISTSIDEISTVVININNPADEEAKLQGMYKDSDKKVYIVDLDANSTKLTIDKATDKHFNSIIGVDDNGNTKTVKLNINSSASASIRNNIIKVEHNNLNNVDQIRGQIESNNIYIKFSKTDLDPTVFNINKSYSINNFDSYNKNNGAYLLANKKESFIRENDSFVVKLDLSFRKIKS